MELQLIESVVQIQKIKLSIRFPGQLTFQFKNNHLYEDISKMFPLVNGQSIVGESVPLQLESTYTVANETYSEVMVDLIISINTASGKIVAGVVSFNALQNGTVTLPFKRCSDKAAVAVLNIGFAKIKKIQDLQGGEPSHKTLDNARSSQSLSMMMKLKSPKAFTESRQQDSPNPRNKSNNSSEESKIHGLMKSKVKVVGAGFDSRVRNIEETHEKKLKTINQQKEQIEQELQKMKERYKLSERREKELQTLTKELKQNLEKRRVKILDLESKQGDFERQQTDSDRRLKSMQAELKIAKQNNDTFSGRCSMLQKKLESKEQSMNEREKRLQSKIIQLQSENNKSIHEYNVLLQKMEVQQKSNQAANKLKEKSNVEERSKWKDQTQRLENELLKLKEINQELSSKSVNLSAHQQNLAAKVSQLEAELQILTRNYDNQKVQLERQNFLNKQLQKQIEDLKGLQEDKAALKKKINENNQDYQKLKDKMDKLLLEHNDVKQHEDQLEDSLEEIRKEKKGLAAKCSDLQKLNGQLNKEVTRLTSQTNSLSAKVTHLNERMNDLKTKSDQQNDSYAQKQASLLSRINSMLQSKEYLQNDLEDYKWSLQKERESILQNQRKLRERSDQILRQQEETLKLKKQLDNYHIEIEETSQQNTRLQLQIADLKRKEQDNLESLKDKERIIYEINKKIKQIQQQGFLSSSKYSKAFEENKEVIRNQDILIEQLQSELEQTKSLLQSSQNEKIKLQQTLQQRIRQLKMLKINLDESEKTCKEEQENNSQLKKRNDNLQKRLEESQGKMSSDEKDNADRINNLRNRVDDLQKQNLNYSNDIQIYKKAMQQLLIIISKQEESNSEAQIIAVPVQNLAKAQLQCLLSRNKYISNFNNKIQELQVEINYLQIQLQKKSKSLNQKHEENQKLIKDNNKQIIDLTQKWQDQKNIIKEQLQSVNSDLANTTTEKQKIQNKYQSLNESYEQEKAALHELQIKYERSCQDTKDLQAKLLDLRQIMIHSKGEDETYVQTLKLEYAKQTERYHQKMNQFIKIQETLEKSIMNKDKDISSLKVTIEMLEEQQTKIQKQFNILTQKYNKQGQEKAQIDLTLGEAQKNIKQLRHNLQSSQIEAESERQLKIQTEQKLNEVHRQLSDILIQKENLEHKLQNITKASSLSGEQQKSKIVQLQQTLQVEIKKSAKLFEQLTERNGQLKLKEFQVKQLTQKVMEADSVNSDLRKQNEDKRSQINRQGQKIQEYKRSILGVEKQKSDYCNEKGAVEEELSQKKQQIEELESALLIINGDMDNLKLQLQDMTQQYEQLKKQKLGLVNNGSELKQNLTDTKKQLQRANARENEAKNKINTLQEQLKQKQEFYQNYKSKNWQQTQSQMNKLRQKIKQVQSQLQKLRQESKFQSQDLRGQLQMLSQEKQDLEGLLQEKEDIIEQQQNELLDSQNRIIALNGELRSCLQAWEKEKAASLPSRRQTIKIEEDMNKFQTCADELNKKTKQILSISTFKIKGQVISKTSHSLVELVEMINRSKSRIMNKAGDADKNEIVKQYDRMREKIEQLLKTQSFGSAKQIR